MHEWSDAYDAGFTISTTQPSTIARLLIPRIPTHSNVLDLGCGTGRNAIYFAQNGHSVDAVDHVDRMPMESIHSDIRSRIHFVCRSVTEPLPQKKYHVALAARLIQYLDVDDAALLMQAVGTRLQNKGLFGVSFTARGGVHEQQQFHLSTFAHTLESVRSHLAQAGFTIVFCEPGATKAMHVPYENEAETYDIIAEKE